MDAYDAVARQKDEQVTRLSRHRLPLNLTLTFTLTLTLTLTVTLTLTLTLTLTATRVFPLTPPLTEPTQYVKEISEAVGGRMSELQQRLHLAKEQAGCTSYGYT